MSDSSIATDPSNPPATATDGFQNRTEGTGRASARPQTGLSGLNPRQRAVLAEAPTSARGILERAYIGKSKAAGIKAFCLHCVGYVRNDVRDCTSFGCPLWPYRPYQTDTDEPDEEREAA